MSIATKTGDSGTTALVGGNRISKSDLRVESYGTVDELNSFLGFARSICSDPEIAGWTETIQRTLFRVGGSLATPLAPEKSAPEHLPATPPTGVTEEDVEYLTSLVHKIENIDGILADWSLPGAHRESAAYEMARTVCRRAERLVVRFKATGETVQPEVVKYLNRLSDLIWLFGRLIEHNAGIDARLRTEAESGPRWSRAW